MLLPGSVLGKPTGVAPGRVPCASHCYSGIIWKAPEEVPWPTPDVGGYSDAFVSFLADVCLTHS